MSLLFNMLSRLDSMASVTICSDFGAQENKVSPFVWKTISPLFPLCPIYLPRSEGTECHDVRVLNVEF